MKTFQYSLLLCGVALLVTSCTLFKPKSGCPTNGKNVGAEKLLDGTSPKAKKFRA